MLSFFSAKNGNFYFQTAITLPISVQFTSSWVNPNQTENI